MKRVSISCLALLTAFAAGAGQAAPPAAVPAYAPPAGAPVCQGADGYAAAFGGRRTFRWRPDWLASVKARRGDPSVAPAYRAILARADAALAGPTYTVVDKLKTPPSGDKHDYMSIGPYWWPDPAKPDGLPYLRRDGKINPERDTNAFDTSDLDAMSGGVEALALAYYFTDDARYAAKAAELLKVWFLDPATRMNPNANFAQGVPGSTPGRAEGVLDTFRLLRVVESIGLLAPSKAISDADQQGLEKWFGDYVTWMATSPTGREEKAAANNHGLWWDYQAAAFGLFAGLDDVARAVAAKAGPARIATQVEPDGKMPLELKRTRALHYTVFALQAAAGVAELGRCVGLDLWRYQTADGRGLRAAIDVVAPYAGREKDFPYPELRPEATEETFELLSLAAWAYGDAGLAAKAAILAPGNAASDVNLVIAPYRP
ncbi:MAG: alginate lyase [Caulobacter sp.]|nr:alginate lyase [Caulobacter sp.]